MSDIFDGYMSTLNQSDYLWYDYDYNSTITMIFNHICSDLGVRDVKYYKCGNDETNLYSTISQYQPDDFDSEWYNNYCINYPMTHSGLLPNGQTANNVTISEYYKNYSGKSPTRIDASEYTYTLNSNTNDFDSLSGTEIEFNIIYYNSYGYTIKSGQYEERRYYSLPEQTETVGSYTIKYFLSPDGHKIVLPEYEQTVKDIYDNENVSGYYVLDYDNKKIKLPISDKKVNDLTVTYGQLILRGLTLIKGNTWNVDSVYDNALPAAYKSGWSYTVDKNALHVTATISSNAVSKVAGTTVDSEYNAYMTDVGMMARSSETITLNGLLQFLHYFSCFCETRIYHWTSQYANPVYIYKSGTVTYISAPTNGSNTDIITAVDENNLGDVLGNIINTTTNIGCTHYNRSVSWTGT